MRLGSTTAMVLGLRQKGIDAHVVLFSHLSSKYAWIFRENAIEYTDVESGWPDLLRLAEFDALLVVDTGTWSQLPGLREKIAGWEVPKLVLDHHLTQEDWASQKLVVTAAGAAGEIVAELLQQWDVTIDKPIATALYLAIVADTGWFQYSNTRPYTLRLAAMLMEAGVDTDSLYKLLYQNERAQRIALQAMAQQSLDLRAGGKLAVMQVSRDDFAAAGANVPDTENLINLPLQIRDVAVSIVLVDPPTGGAIRVSLRSKGQVDVARFAEQFGGGGHARAAGLKLETTLDEARHRVVSAMEATLGEAAPAISIA